MQTYNTSTWFLGPEQQDVTGCADTSFKNCIKFQPLPLKTLAVFVMMLTTERAMRDCLSDCLELVTTALALLRGPQ